MVDLASPAYLPGDQATVLLRTELRGVRIRPKEIMKDGWHGSDHLRQGTTAATFDPNSEVSLRAKPAAFSSIQRAPQPLADSWRGFKYPPIPIEERKCRGTVVSEVVRRD